MKLDISVMGNFIKKNTIIIIGIIVFVLFMLSGVKANADSLITTIGAKSDHMVKGDFNEENHNWIGVGYRFVEKDKYSVQVETVSFVNSYYDDTKFFALTGIYTPIKWRDIKLGISGSIGYQEGYYVNKEGTVHPRNAKRLGMSNKSVLVLYSLYAEIDNIVLNYTYIPSSVQAITVGFKAVEW